MDLLSSTLTAKSPLLIATTGPSPSAMSTKGQKKDSTTLVKKTDEVEDRVKMWRETFDLVAENEDYIFVGQLLPMLKSLGFTVEDDEFSFFGYREKIFFDDFVRVAMEKQTQLEYEHRLGNAFRAFDLDKCGYLSAEVLRHILCYLGNKMTEEEVNAIFEEFEIDEDEDEVDYEDIMYIMVHREWMEDVC